MHPTFRAKRLKLQYIAKAAEITINCTKVNLPRTRDRTDNIHITIEIIYYSMT